MSGRPDPNVVSEHESTAESVILCTNSTSFLGHLDTCTQHIGEALPTRTIDGTTIPLRDEPIALEADRCSRCPLVELILQEFGDDLFCTDILQEIGQEGRCINTGDESGSALFQQSCSGHKRLQVGPTGTWEQSLELGALLKRIEVKRRRSPILPQGIRCLAPQHRAFWVSGSRSVGSRCAVGGPTGQARQL